MNKVIDIFKGIAVGVANVIPGFSGGTMAIILNIYERLVNGISNFFKKPLGVLKDLWAFIIGLVIGILFSVLLIVKLIKVFTLPVIMLFVGMIIGSIPSIYKDTFNENSKVNYNNIIFFIISLVIIIILPFINVNSNSITTNNVFLYIIIFVMGIVASCAMILPGISGSLVLMIFGYYFFITGAIKDLFASIFNSDFNNFINNFIVIIIFIIGCILGLILFSNIIKKLLLNHKKVFISCILGLLIGSIFTIVYKTSLDYPNMFNISYIYYIISFVMLCTGFFSTYYLEKKTKGNRSNL